VRQQIVLSRSETMPSGIGSVACRRNTSQVSGFMRRRSARHQFSTVCRPITCPDTNLRERSFRRVRSHRHVVDHRQEVRGIRRSSRWLSGSPRSSGPVVPASVCSRTARCRRCRHHCSARTDCSAGVIRRVKSSFKITVAITGITDAVRVDLQHILFARCRVRSLRRPPSDNRFI